jgi:hypothetical protein
MKERDEISIEQKGKDDAIMDFENYRAQEAILDPNLPDWYVDKILSSAIATITQVGERKGTYNPKPKEAPNTSKQK